MEGSGSHSCPDRQDSMISCQDSPVALLVVLTQTKSFADITAENTFTESEHPRSFNHNDSAAYKSSPEQKHERAEKCLEIVVLVDVTLVIQLDVSKHLQENIWLQLIHIFARQLVASSVAAANLPESKTIHLAH